MSQIKRATEHKKHDRLPRGESKKIMALVASRAAKADRPKVIKAPKKGA